MKRIILILLSLILCGSVFASGQIDIASVPFIITTSGSYILVKDLQTSSNQTAIIINASDVTIDLNGHTLYGAGTTVGTVGYGVFAPSGSANISVYNGTVRDFRSYGIRLNGFNCLVYLIRAYGNKLDGIHIVRDGIVKDNIVQNNGNVGIDIGEGSLAKDNIAYTNSVDGILAGNNCTITGNSLNSNGDDGISSMNGCTIIGNSSYGNNDDGITAQLGATVENNTLRYNAGDGIEVDDVCQVVGNACNSNGLGSSTAAGIRVTGTDNNIEKNNISQNDVGLLIESAGNFYASNRAATNSLSNYSTVGAQTDGASIDTSLSNVSFYSQPNFLIQQFAGYEIPYINESPHAILRNLKW